MRVEVHATQMASRVVALVVLFAGLASLAICKKRLVGRRVDGHPYLTRLPVDSIGMAPQLMLTSLGSKISAILERGTGPSSAWPEAPHAFRRWL